MIIKYIQKIQKITPLVWPSITCKTNPKINFPSIAFSPWFFEYIYVFFAEMVQHFAYSSQKQTNKRVLNFTEGG